MPLIDPTAAQSGFELFYHYQRFDRLFLTEMLRDKKLYFSDPHNVNDPWDCKPYFDYRPLLADPAKREATILNYQSFLPDSMLADPRRLVYEHQLRTDDGELIAAVEGSSKVLGAEIAKRRIYCLTPFPDSTLMWSHYASNHRGICLEFDKHNPLIGRARPVPYRKSYPEWTPYEVGNNPLDLVLTKSADWSYEREFRILASPFVADDYLKLQGNYVPLPVGVLKAIVIGCESPDHDEVCQIVEAFAPGLPIKRAVRVPNEYRLTIQG